MTDETNIEDFEIAEDEATPVEKTISDEVRAAFVAAHDADKDDDSVKIEMISAGAKFKKVTKMFNDLMVEYGYAVSKEEKSKAVASACVDVEWSTEDGFATAVANMTGALDSVSDKSAASSIRAYAKKNDLECFKKPKAAGGGTRTTFLTDFYDALYENPSMSEEEAKEFIEKNGTKNTIRWAKAHQRVRILTNRIAAKDAD